jgi:cysteine synthase
MIFENIPGATGNIPIVKLNHVLGNLGNEVFAKLELMNPGGFIIDRIEFWLIENAEPRGFSTSWTYT